MSKFFKDLKEGLEEAIDYQKGKKTLRSKTIDIPEPAKEYKAAEIKRIRAKGNYSQGVFAKVLNVSLNTVQSWELGVRNPNHAALRLLEIVDKGIYRPKITRRNA